ncbi:PadR family transcriptional regulator [Nocardia otitidiscaviarum]|nr:PadR family transcriptional regulator [Nocardia otitidiscaviarum]
MCSAPANVSAPISSIPAYRERTGSASCSTSRTGERRYRVANRDPLRNWLALTVLAYLLERPMHPYELGKLLKDRNAARSVDYKHASVYMVVEQLVRAGYVEAQRTERQGQRPERTVYRHTETGRVALRERMRELVAVPAKEYSHFQAALSLIVVLPPKELPELLDRRRRALDDAAAELRTTVRAAEDVDPIFLIECDYRLELIEAELRFIARFDEHLRRDSRSLGEFWHDLHER